jgi:uncharacterized protein YjbI with pentapeptide repeats
MFNTVHVSCWTVNRDAPGALRRAVAVLVLAVVVERGEQLLALGVVAGRPVVDEVADHVGQGRHQAGAPKRRHASSTAPSVFFVISSFTRGALRLAAIVGLALAAAAVVGALIWPITDLIAAHDVSALAVPQRAVHLQAARETARTQLLTLGAGVFAAAALVYTARNFGLSRAGQVTDRYTKAIEQLGSKKLDVRIGGIYALERVALDSARDHPTVMEVLTTFIREHSGTQLPQCASDADAAPTRTIRPDVQAAVTVVGRRDETRDRRRIVLSGANLAGADLIRANLSSTSLAVQPGFLGDLIRLALPRANAKALVKTATNLGLVRTNLIRADLTDAKLVEAHLNRADLVKAVLTGAVLIHADLTRANLTRANLTRANLTGAKVTGIDLTGADLTGTLFPAAAAVPEGWVRDADSGRLKRVNKEPGDVS